MISIEYNSKGVVEKLTTLAAQLERPEDLAKVVGAEGVSQLKEHFLDRDQYPNRLGGDRTHYWRGVADMVNRAPVVLDDGRTVKINISHPTFAQKVKGGTITAKRAVWSWKARAQKITALTIPVSADAHGRSARTLQHDKGIRLFLVGGRGQGPGLGALAARDASGNVTIHYVLKRSVTQRPDPRALPDQATFALALLAAAEEYVEDITQGGTNS